MPKLVVFYNGLADQLEERMLNLSDAFPEAVRDEADISVRVGMININKDHSAGVVNSCKLSHICSNKKTALFPIVHKL